MNYRSVALSEIDSLAENFPDYTVGQIILAITRRKPEGISLSEWLYTVEDRQIYADIEKTKLIENKNGIIRPAGSKS